jgi:hypothetical protein
VLIGTYCAAPFVWLPAHDAVLQRFVHGAAEWDTIKAELTPLTDTMPNRNQLAYRLKTLRQKAGVVGPLPRRRSKPVQEFKEFKEFMDYNDGDRDADSDSENDSLEDYGGNPLARKVLERIEQLTLTDSDDTETDTDDGTQSDGGDDNPKPRKRNGMQTARRRAENWNTCSARFKQRFAARFGMVSGQVCDNPGCSNPCTHKCFKCTPERHLCNECVEGPHRFWCADHSVHRWQPETCSWVKVPVVEIFVAAPGYDSTPHRLF